MSLIDPDLTAVEAALTFEGIPPQVRTRVLNRLVHGDPAGPGYPGVTAERARIVGAQLLEFAEAPAGELVGQEMAAMARDMWASAPGTVSRFWLEWNVTPPPGGLPARLMRMAAQIDPPQDARAPQRALECANRDELT